jgi:hypothetical protein
MNNKLIAGLAAVAVLFSGLSFFAGPTDTIVERTIEKVGAQVGPDHYDHQTFFANFTVGGDANSRYATTSTATTFTLTATELRKKNTYVTWNNGRPALTLTTMASTSAPFKGMKVGETFTQTWYNSSTTANTITFAAGTGVDLQEVEGLTVTNDTLEAVTLKFIKKVDTDVMMIVTPYQLGDS